MKRSGVKVIAEIQSHAVFLLKEKTQFWLVSPKATLTSISGSRHTYFQEVTLACYPGKDSLKPEFTAAPQSNQSIYQTTPYYLNFKSDTAAANSVGTPIFFQKNTSVGEIARVRILIAAGHFVTMQAFIEK